MTKAQRTALDKLKAMHPFTVEHTQHGNDVVRTGLNTTTLRNLQSAGYISFDRQWLGGLVTADLVITAKGWKA